MSALLSSKIDHVSKCLYKENSAETGSGQSTYPGQINGSLFLQVMWVTRSNHKKLDNPVYNLSMVIVDSEQDSEHLSISDCHSSEHNELLLVFSKYCFFWLCVEEEKCER